VLRAAATGAVLDFFDRQGPGRGYLDSEAMPAAWAPDAGGSVLLLEPEGAARESLRGLETGCRFLAFRSATEARAWVGYAMAVHRGDARLQQELASQLPQCCGFDDGAAGAYGDRVPGCFQRGGRAEDAPEVAQDREASRQWRERHALEAQEVEKALAKDIARACRPSVSRNANQDPNSTVCYTNPSGTMCVSGAAAEERSD